MATLQVGGQPLPGTFTNHFLAHLQVATAARFASGRGFFLTTAQSGGDGAEQTVSHWIHPGVSLAFGYDVADGAGGRVAPEALQDNEIEEITAAMDTPYGVRGSDGLWWPFSEQA